MEARSGSSQSTPGYKITLTAAASILDIWRAELIFGAPKKQIGISSESISA